MSNDFRASMDLIANWIEDYRRGIRSQPVLSRAQPGDILRQLPAQAAREPESFGQIFEDFRRIIVPGITHWQHPNFFGYFPSNSSPPSVLAEMLIAAMGVQGMSWITSPAATELEMRMMEWLRELFGLPTAFTGVIQDSASSSTLAAMIAARERATNFRVNEEGYAGRELVVYCSTETHSSVEKAAKIMGVGRRGLRKIAVDGEQRIRADLLEAAIREDLQAGRQPFCIVGAFGTTATTAVDDLDALADIAERYKLWLHVDAAYAGAALILPEMRGLARGLERADSLVVNPHKWLLTTFDCSTFFVRHREDFVKTFEILPEYLKTPEGELVTNYRDWGLGLGRRFRSLKLWFVLRWYGVEGLQAILRRHVAISAKLESWIRADSDFEIAATRHFNLVCFRHRAGCAENKRLLQVLNESGEMFLSHAKVDGNIVLRMVTGQTDVTEADVRIAWERIRATARELGLHGPFKKGRIQGAREASTGVYRV